MLPVISPDIHDHVQAAELRNLCRRKGVQVGTIDALIASLCIRHGLLLLTTDRDFEAMTRHCDLWIDSSPADCDGQRVKLELQEMPSNLE